MKSQHHTTLFTIGRPLGPLYAMAMKLRGMLYHHDIMKRVNLDVPVISVGNLTMGGSGKTPMVIYIARMLKNHGKQPAIVSRGYHGTSKNPVNIVSDGSRVLMDAETAGDEPLMIARTLRDVVVATGKKRARVCRELLENYSCDVIILDDGFQHLGLARDIDLVLFDVEHFAGNSRVFPGGDLREPISALRRCSAFIITGVTENCLERAGKCSALLHRLFPEKPAFVSSPAYRGFVKYRISTTSVERENIARDDVPNELFGFSGIAQPERFYRMVKTAGINLSGRKLFADHNRYANADLEALHGLAAQYGVSGFLTTEKDITKLAELKHNSPLPFYVPILENLPNHDLDTFIIEQLKE